MKKNNYIYLLHEREFVNLKSSIYKIGRTKQDGLKRFYSYPKNSILLFHIVCTDCIKYEQVIITQFIKTFKQRQDIGTEYFEGDYKHMIDIIYNIINNTPEKSKIFTDKYKNKPEIESYINLIIQKFNKNYYIQKTLGNQLFEGDVKNMINTLFITLNSILIKDNRDDTKNIIIIYKKTDENKYDYYYIKRTSETKIISYFNNKYIIVYIKKFEDKIYKEEIFKNIIKHYNMFYLGIKDIQCVNCFNGNFSGMLKILSDENNLHDYDEYNYNNRPNNINDKNNYNYIKISNIKYQTKIFNKYVLKYIEKKFINYNEDIVFNGNKKLIRLTNFGFVKYINNELKKLIYRKSPKKNEHINSCVVNYEDTYIGELLYDKSPTEHEIICKIKIYNNEYINYFYNLKKNKIIETKKTYDYNNVIFKNLINKTKFNINIEHFNILLDYYNFDIKTMEYDNKYISDFFSFGSSLNNILYFSSGIINNLLILDNFDYINYMCNYTLGFYLDYFLETTDTKQDIALGLHGNPQTRKNSFMYIYLINGKYYHEKSFLKKQIPRLILYNDNNEYLYICENTKRQFKYKIIDKYKDIYNHTFILFDKYHKPWRSENNYTNYKNNIENIIKTNNLTICKNDMYFMI